MKKVTEITNCKSCPNFSSKHERCLETGKRILNRYKIDKDCSLKDPLEYLEKYKECIFTAKQVRILNIIAETNPNELTMARFAEELNISARTLEIHLKKINDKTRKILTASGY